jgi:hypothetical protein
MIIDQPINQATYIAYVIDTNCMEQNPSWEADSHSLSQQIPCSL